MTEYFKKLKDALNGTPDSQPTTMPSSSLSQELANIRDTPNQIRQLRYEIAEIKKWKDSDAVPKISKSLANIDAINKEITGNIHPEIKGIHLDISQNIVPQINDAVRKSLEASNLAINAGEAAELAKTKALGAAESVGQIYERLQRSSAQLKKDATAIKDATINMHAVITTEAKNISDAFQKYGITISNATIGVANSSRAVAQQMYDAYREIQPALQQVKTYSYLLWRDRWNLIAVAYNTYMALAYLAFAGAGGQSAVLWEVIEGFQQINGAFNSLSNNFKTLSSVSKNAPLELSNVIMNSMSRISSVMDAFTQSFVNLSNNLSGNLAPQ